VTGALPLPVRNRLAELILEAFDDPEARMTLVALDAACGGAPLPPGAADRIRALGWFEPAGNGWRLRGGYRVHQSALAGRVRAALALPGEAGAADDPATRTGVLGRAARLADAGLFFEAHELLEPAWMRAEGRERTALQALIQVAVACHHAEHGNRAGAVSLLAEGLAKLVEAGAVLPLRTEAWAGALGTALEALRAGRPVSAWPPWPRPTVP
jgi:hypothetical protein